MDQPPRRGRAPVGAVLVVVLLAVGGATGPAAAQERSPAAVEASPAPEQQAAPAAGQDPGGPIAGRFPATLGGQPLTVETFSAEEWIARADPASAGGAAVAERIEALAAAGGGSLADLTLASALHEPSPGNHAAITAVRVAGARAGDLVNAAITLLLPDLADPQVRLRSIAGRPALRVTDAAMPGVYPRTVLPVGDTVWVVEAEGEPLAEILAVLPRDERGADPAAVDELMTSFPDRLGGARRSELYVAAGWGGPISAPVGALFGPDDEDIAVRLFLTSGTTLEDLTWAYGVWSGPEESATVLAAFQIAGVDAAVMQEVLTEVLLPGFSSGFEQPAQATGEVAGREVVSLSDEGVPEAERASQTFHFTVIGDTIWMVNVPTADAEVVAEAIGQVGS